MAKNKMKTHKGSSKGINHNTGKNSAKRSRQKRKGNELNNSDYKRIKTLLG